MRKVMICACDELGLPRSWNSYDEWSCSMRAFHQLGSFVMHDSLSRLLNILIGASISFAAIVASGQAFAQESVGGSAGTTPITQRSVNAKAENDASAVEYVISPGDSMDISVFNLPE